MNQNRKTKIPRFFLILSFSDSVLPSYCSVEFLLPIEPKMAIVASASPVIAGVPCRVSLRKPFPDKEKLKLKREKEMKEAMENQKKEAQRIMKGEREWQKKAHLNPRYAIAGTSIGSTVANDVDNLACEGQHRTGFRHQRLW